MIGPQGAAGSRVGRKRAGEMGRRYLHAPGPEGLFTRLARVGLRLDAFRERCLGGHGLRFVDFSVLRVLRKQGPPHAMSPSELAELVLRPTGGMTQVLDRLEREGLVERRPDPGDRRRVLVALTEGGLARVERASVDYQQARHEVLGALGPSELEEVDRAVRRLLEIFGEDLGDDDSRGDGPGDPP